MQRSSYNRPERRQDVTRVDKGMILAPFFVGSLAFVGLLGKVLNSLL